MLRVTKLADYGVLMMTRFAAHSEEIQNAKDIAINARLPLPMVGKILKILSRHGLLASHRGTKGGYRLARKPEDISIAAIIRALEGPIAVTECTDVVNGNCELQRGCPVSTNWSRINQALEEALEKITLAEMMKTIRKPVLKITHPQ
jgi:FeS assembly SUF system regulator